ncbi:MAG: glycosyltransferase family 2 protein, partial [Thermodesulfobacteriota bacterium]
METHYHKATIKRSEPLVSIIIPTKDRIDLLRKCINSIESKSHYRNCEIIVIDNNSKKAESKSYLSSIKHKVVPFNEPYNSARIDNFGAKHAAGEYLIFLNNDTEVISPDWIERMLEQCSKPDVGAVGVKLLYPDNTVQHAGVLIGVAGVASHAFEGLPRDHLGYQGFLQSVRKCSAVTSACMMVRKKTLQEVGGFDENLAYAYDDIDLCLRLRKKGYSIVYTPYAELYHHTSSSRPLTVPLEINRYFYER